MAKLTRWSLSAERWHRFGTCRVRAGLSHWWPRILLAVAIGLNTGLIAANLSGSLFPADYRGYIAVVSSIGRDPFAVPGFRWSPLAAYLLIPVVLIGLTGWRVAHLALLVLLRDWRLVSVTLVAWPFWYDVRLGSTFFVAYILAAAALGGSRWASVAYLGLFLVMPRPLMLPVAAWLLWQRPRLLRLAALGLLFELGLLAATHELLPWVYALVESTGEIANPTNIGPSACVGSAWLILGVPLAIWLTWKGRLGLASLAASPYWLPYYLLFALLELVPIRRRIGAKPQ